MNCLCKKKLSKFIMDVPNNRTCAINGQWGLMGINTTKIYFVIPPLQALEILEPP